MTTAPTTCNLAALKVRKEFLFQELTRINGIVAKTGFKDSIEAEAQLAALSRHEASFTDLVREILTANTLVKSSEAVSVKDFDAFQTLIDAIRKHCLRCKASDGSQHGPQAPQQQINQAVRLPKITLPTFSGDIGEWNTFLEQYNALVHSKPISNVEKLTYLKSVLSREPLAIVNQYELRDTSYPMAYNDLLQRYNNPRILANYYLNKIVSYTHATGSTKQFTKFQEIHRAATSGLRNLGIPDLADFLMFDACYRNLPLNQQKVFDRENNSDAVPTLNQLLNFIDNLARTEELHTEGTTGIIKDGGRRKNPKVLLGVKDEKIKSWKCPNCKQNHPLFRCKSFASLPADKKEAIVRNRGLCRQCLSDHRNACQSTYNCRYCQSKQHHSFLCDNSPDSAVKQESVIEKREVEVTPQQACNACVSKCSSSVLLGTIQAIIVDDWGKRHKVRVVCDTGSQVNLITNSLVKRLGLKRSSAAFDVQGVSGYHSKVLGTVQVKLQGHERTSASYECSALILPSICGELPVKLTASDLPENLKTLPLADPEFQDPKEVEVLLGADAYTDILSTSEPTIIKGNPTAIHTVFGFMLIGRTTASNISRAVSLCTTTLDKTLRAFWEVECVGQIPTKNPEEVMCEEHFQKTHGRTTNGKYVVRLPFRPDAPKLGSNLRRGLRSFSRLEERFKRSPSLFNSYTEVIQDYMEQGHMSVAPHHERYVLPHHGVYKDSTTTALRVVFDASAPDESNVTLNSLLLSGPKLQNELPRLLIRFRFHEVALQADIKQMFRNIELHPEDRKYQRILWRFSPEEQLRQYCLNTVTFGLTSSPFLAQRVLRQLVEDEGGLYPEASHCILNHSFVDDFATGAPSVAAAKALQRDLTILLEKGGFQLRKWACSHPEVLKGVPIDHLETPFIFPTGEKGVKILGLLWDQTSDSLRYHVTEFEGSVTKRSVASYVAKIWDCLGLLAPVVLKGKYFLQRLWLEKLDWDEPITSDLCTAWRKYTEEMPCLTQLSIPRRLPNRLATLRLVGFSDASEIAMAAAVYLHATFQDGRVECQLIMAKTKLAPLKTWTIPRLELSAALLLTKVVESVQESELRDLPIHLFTDSQIVLAWLRIPPHNLKIFVANRVIQILEALPKAVWSFVPGDQNPADFGSRGLNPNQIINNILWWNGPTFLHQPSECWNTSSQLEMTLEDCPETKSSVPTLIVRTPTRNLEVSELLDKFSSLTKLQRVVAYILRFANNCRKEVKCQDNYLTTKELEVALLTCVRLTQELHFQPELTALEKGGIPTTTLRKLNPFLDTSRLLRAGGRLRRAGSLSEEAKYPLLLPKECNLSHLICDHYHIKLLHAGPRTTQAAILQRYWIVGMRQLLKKRIRLCLRCHKLSATPGQPIMGELPYSRINISRPFTAVALDFGGPIITKESRIRRSTQHKSYLCVFICMATKAVHIEAVTELTSKAFLAAFARFSSRRGTPLHVYSDCGRNFVGAARELKEGVRAQGDETAVKEFAATQGISWHFAPPYGPNFNGLAEGAIKSAKRLLLRQVGNEVLTFEEFATLLCRIEAVLNSRPLTTLGSDPNEELYLSPAHFLIGDRILSPPESEVETKSLKNRWESIQQKSQAFWKQWSREYLQTLLHRQRWTKPSENLRVGQVVFVTGENLSPLQWPIGRITAVQPGEDGVVRVVTIRCGKGELQRPASKVLVLPENE